jgi:hypothetical protein
MYFLIIFSQHESKFVVNISADRFSLAHVSRCLFTAIRSFRPARAPKWGTSNSRAGARRRFVCPQPVVATLQLRPRSIQMIRFVDVENTFVSRFDASFLARRMFGPAAVRRNSQLRCTKITFQCKVQWSPGVGQRRFLERSKCGLKSENVYQYSAFGV